MTAIQAGDRDAFAAMYDRYADHLYDFCVGVLRDKHDAEDAVQDTFALAVQQLGQLDMHLRHGSEGADLGEALGVSEDHA
ncbi:hypothetical protein [Alloactinosynnema sp. L-07]|uniref:RNA polymerase sigma factor n=1 Tax=Alloactinosynnema sp. L-07 TaxID=1653480 RepID=UPI00065F021A|nr:sigma factor [Alloactinosynnema sp. L-07]CRK58512.1 hypothetical protein [Alloactinosynnema sp. L-07]